MYTQDDLEFYKSREREERRLAAKSFNPRVKAIHLEMAGCYAYLVATLEVTGAVTHEPRRVASG